MTVSTFLESTTGSLRATLGSLDSTTAISLLGDRQLNTLALGQRDPWLLLANDEDVGLSSSEGVINGILDVDDVEATIVSLTVSDNTNTAHVTTTSNHSNYTSVEADEVGDLAGREVDLDSVIHLDGRVGIADTINPHQHSLSCLSNHSLIQRLIDATYVRASCVTKYGIPPLPTCTLLTLPSLYSASACSTR